MVVRPDLCTLGGIAHGGAIMSFADTLGGALAFVNLPDGGAGRRPSRARQISSARRRGSDAHGHCSVIHRGRRTQVMQTRVETEEGQLVALVIQTQMTL